MGHRVVRAVAHVMEFYIHIVLRSYLAARQSGYSVLSAVDLLKFSKTLVGKGFSVSTMEGVSQVLQTVRRSSN